MSALEAVVPISTVNETSGPFTNEPATDFKRAENARAMRVALEKVGRELGREYENVIGGHRIRTAAKLQSVNPSHPEQLIGTFQKAGAEDAATAVDAALTSFLGLG